MRILLKKNQGLNLDLRNSAHIQTADNFDKGKIATHNKSTNYQDKYDEWRDKFEVHDQNGEDHRIGDIKTHTLRSGQTVKIVKKDARKPFDKNRPTGSTERKTDMDHTISAAEIIRDPKANAFLTLEEQVGFANGEVNLKEMDRGLNRSKKDTPTQDWYSNTNSKGQRPTEAFHEITTEEWDEILENDRNARIEYGNITTEAERKHHKAGRKSQLKEAKLFGGKVIRSIVMGLFADLIKTILQKLIVWFRSGKESNMGILQHIEEAISHFVKNFKRKLKQHLSTAAETTITTIATAIFNPVKNIIKKAWIFLKQGYRSLKEAIQYIKDKKNRNKPFSILMLEVGKIVIAGLTAGGAIVLSGVIEKSLIAIPFFTFHIPLLGSLASILGIFLGALVSGIIGAIALNLIDKAVANKQQRLNTSQQISKKNTIIQKQHILIKATSENHKQKKQSVLNEMNERHELAGDIIQESLSTIKMNQSSSSELKEKNSNNIDQILSDLSQEL